MNRKLQHSVKALSATAAVFALLLFAGGPPRPAGPVDGATIAASIDASADEAPAASRPLRRRSARAALALPYFSFAQGLRRVAGS